ncbi:hypothetical protein JX266_009786 [Neoarthrinium moseri]|nr:hypothetical protein JX266_009786 [Neoarthrinium moseri]
MAWGPSKRNESQATCSEYMAAQNDEMSAPREVQRQASLPQTDESRGLSYRYDNAQPTPVDLLQLCRDMEEHDFILGLQNPFPISSLAPPRLSLSQATSPSVRTEENNELVQGLIQILGQPRFSSRHLPRTSPAEGIMVQEYWPHDPDFQRMSEYSGVAPEDQTPWNPTIGRREAFWNGWKVGTAHGYTTDCSVSINHPPAAERIPGYLNGFIEGYSTGYEAGREERQRMQRESSSQLTQHEAARIDARGREVQRSLELRLRAIWQVPTEL